MQCTIILPACIHEWSGLNRNIQVEINNQSLSEGRKKEREEKENLLVHCIQLC